MLPQSRQQRLLVTPPYDLSDASTGVHLRWVLANSVLERLQAQKVSPERLAFVSIHADSLHPSVRGLMVYVPVASPAEPRARSPAGIWPCEETREPEGAALPATPSTPGPRRSRGSSARRWCGRRGGSGSRCTPTSRCARRCCAGARRWVPAVLRYNRVPTSVLVEICNLTNEDDRAAAADRPLPGEAGLRLAAGLAEAFSR